MVAHVPGPRVHPHPRGQPAARRHRQLRAAAGDAEMVHRHRRRQRGRARRRQGHIIITRVGLRDRVRVDVVGHEIGRARQAVGERRRRQHGGDGLDLRSLRVARRVRADRGGGDLRAVRGQAGADPEPGRDTPGRDDRRGGAVRGRIGRDRDLRHDLGTLPLPRNRLLGRVDRDAVHIFLARADIEAVVRPEIGRLEADLPELAGRARDARAGRGRHAVDELSVADDLISGG